MKLLILVSSAPLALAGVGQKCTFPTRGDSSDPACVWDDYAAPWEPAFADFRCCLLPASENINCDYANNPISEAQCAAINASNANCSAATPAAGYFSPGFTSTNWNCDDFAPDCLETLACDTDNGYVGTPWIMCNEDGGVFEMFGCVRGAVDPDAHNEVYLPYKYMNLDLSGGNAKTSLSTTADSCDETNCAAFVAGNGACNPLGECQDLGDYWIYQDAEYTDMYPDVATDLYVNPFRWLGPPEQSETPLVTDQTDPGSGIRFGDLQFFSPMFDCFGASARGTARYRDETILEIDQSQGATGLVLDQYRFTQSVYDYIVNDLGVDESLLTQSPGASHDTPSGTTDNLGRHRYYGRIEPSNGDLSTDYPVLAGKFVGGPLICNINNGQGCTVEGCAWMCQTTDRCDAFSIWDFCDTSDTDALRPRCDYVNALVAESGGTAEFDESLRAVCTFHFVDDDTDWDFKFDASKGRASLNYEKSGALKNDPDCAQYNTARCQECTDCGRYADDSGAVAHYNQQGVCQSGNPACKANKNILDISTEWGYFKDNANSECGLCPKHCISCDDANHCDTCSDTDLFTVNADSTGCYEIGCTIDFADAPANTIGDADGASSAACVQDANVEPYNYCDIVCEDGYYQDSGTSATAFCNNRTTEWPTMSCAECSEVGCAQCDNDICSSCVDGYAHQSDNTCSAVACPLATQNSPNCTYCDEAYYGTISFDSVTATWDVSGCSLCSELLSNCDICNGTSAGDAVCQACASGYVLDENDDCIAQQYCPDGTEGTVTYLSGGDFNFTDCTADDACPDTGEVAPECADCADGYVGAVSWVRTSDTAGNWDTSQCELVACPSEDETSPSCTVCPWGFTGTPYWDDSSNTWAGCASNEFGLSQLSASVQRSAARSTTPLLQSRGVVASFSADGSVVQAVESAPYVLERDSSGYFYKDNGAFNTAENHWNCEPGYGGADCSLRLCPHSLSFFADGSDSFSVGGSEGLFWTTDVGQKSSATFHGRHVYRECSGRGVCDYTIGECQCFDGFTGRGCRRRECPNACSGHGVCVDDNINLYHNTHATGSEESLPTGSYPTSAASADSNLWASELQQACVCDGGWSGHDCSLRLCPVGDDPETECNDELAYDVQEITCTGVDKDVDHFFSVTYTSPLGHRYTTMPVIVSSFQTVDNVTSTTSSLQQALEALPNFAVPSVEVDTSLSDLAGSDISVVMAVTFNDPANTGEQPLLQVTASERCEAGSSPYFVNTDTSTTCTVARVSQSTSLREQAECSNRGLCNTRTGECACYDGYGGRACQTVSATI